MSIVKVKWQASDGYVGGARPQVTIIDASDYIGLSRLEAEKMFDEDMENAFREKVCWYCDDYEASLGEVIAAAAKLNAEDGSDAVEHAEPSE